MGWGVCVWGGVMRIATGQLDDLVLGHVQLGRHMMGCAATQPPSPNP